MDTRTTLAELAVKEFHCDPTKISESCSISELGIDSLGLLEFIFRVEEVFGIQIDNSDAEKLKSLGDIASLVDRLRVAAA